MNYRLYTFGYKIEEDEKTWLKTINDLVAPHKLSNGSPSKDVSLNIEKRWLEHIEAPLKKVSDIQVCGLKIKGITPNFNRYQNYVYLNILFYEMDDWQTPFARFKEHVQSIIGTNGFLDNFLVPFKEDSFVDALQVGSEKYREYVRFENPVKISESDADAKGKLGIVNVDYDYVYDKSKQYIRVLEQTYYLDQDHSEQAALKHFHSLFVMFHRSHAYYEALSMTDGQTKVLIKIAQALNKIWPEERIKLMALGRIRNARLYNKTFFSILELNAQMDSIYLQLISHMQNTKNRFDKQFERVELNFQLEACMDTLYYDKLRNYLLAPYNERMRNLERFRATYEPTDSQIEKFRSNNDSEVNNAIQWTMGVLSIIVFVWGILTVWYQSTFEILDKIPDLFWIEKRYLPMILTVIIVSIISLFAFLVTRYLMSNTSGYSPEVLAVIKKRKVEKDAIEKISESLKGHSDSRSRLYDVSEFLKMITVDLIMNRSNKDEAYDNFIKCIQTAVSDKEDSQSC